jgi:signal transduction histidine kinase
MRAPGPRSIGVRFILSLFILAVLAALIFGFIVAERAGRDMKERSRAVLDESRQRLGEELDRVANTQADLLDQSVQELSDRFGRELADIPFDLFEGREAELRALLVERLDEMRDRNRENAGVVSELFREREGRRVEAMLAALERRQAEEVDRFRRDVTRRMLMLGGLFLLGVAGLIALAFYLQVLGPLRSMTEGMESLRRGELGRRLKVDGGEEIQRLAATFNEMAEAVEEARRDLETRVDEKTRALRTSLAEQRATNEELERTQEQLVESAKMAALGTMARGMAHEFNNVLGGIAGCAEDLIDDEAAEDRREVLEVILRSARRATVVTENLKSFGRGADGGRAPVQLAEVVRTAILLVEPDATRRGVAVEFSGIEGEEGEALPALLTDARAIQQVLLNLLINAVQASVEGGRVRVELGPGEDGGENTQVLRVIDVGRGISAEDLPRVFEPFFTTRDDEGGTGLGLSVSHGIVNALGGRIRAQSEGPGRGSQFEMILPDDGGESER